MFDLATIQAALREFSLDGWLLYDFRGSNVLALRVLDLESRPRLSRRFLYYIPREGAPRKLVHRIEPGALDHLPGEKTVYVRWQDFEAGVSRLIAGSQRIAMEYSPRNANPYISRVDAGTIELVRGTGAEILSSGDLIQLFEATWDDEQWAMHREAERHTTSAFTRAWDFIAREVRAAGETTEKRVMQEIMRHFSENGLTTYHPPIVAVGPHSGDPHYETGDAPIRAGDFVLIDLWAKLDRPRSVYSDLTRVGFVGTEVPDRYEQIFQIVAQARDAAIARVREAFAGRSGTSSTPQTPLYGWQVDEAAREVITAAGYGDAFVHRTGHSIGQETHGNGANMDNLEAHDERQVMRRTCFSIEPGIYLPEFGIRSEVNVFIDAAGEVHVTGGPVQTRVLPILAEF